MLIRHFCTVTAATLIVVANGSLGWAGGTVTTELVDGNLIVLGDGEANVVWLTGDVENMILRVEGDTTASFPLHDVSKLVITTGNGDDLVHLAGTLPGDLSISTGAGADAASTFLGPGATVLGNVDVESGQGDDYLDLHRINVLGTTRISTGQGLDHLRLGGEFQGDLNVNLGVNNDVMEILQVWVAGNVILIFGQGDDWLDFSFGSLSWLQGFGNARIEGDQGANRVYPSLNVFIAGDLNLSGF